MASKTPFVAKSRAGMSLPVEKHCPKCDEVKPSADFHLSRSERDGLQWACKACLKEMNKLADEKKLAYKPFSLLLQQVLTRNDNKKLLALVNKVFDTAMSDSPAAVTAQKLLIERLEGKLREEVALTTDTGTAKLISDANDLLKRIRTPSTEPEELYLPVKEETAAKTTH